MSNEYTVNIDEMVESLREGLRIVRKLKPEFTKQADEYDQKLDTALSILYSDIIECQKTGDPVPVDVFRDVRKEVLSFLRYIAY